MSNSADNFIMSQIERQLTNQGISFAHARAAAEAGVREGRHYHGKDKFGHCFRIAAKNAEQSEPGKRITLLK